MTLEEAEINREKFLKLKKILMKRLTLRYVEQRDEFLIGIKDKIELILYIFFILKSIRLLL
jgi:hypothetical protein